MIKTERERKKWSINRNLCHPSPPPFCAELYSQTFWFRQFPIFYSSSSSKLSIFMCFFLSLWSGYLWPRFFFGGGGGIITISPLDTVDAFGEGKKNKNMTIFFSFPTVFKTKAFFSPISPSWSSPELSWKLEEAGVTRRGRSYKKFCMIPTHEKQEQEQTRFKLIQ